MFSVDNFYDFLDSHYGWDQTGSMLWRFFPHGSKRLFDLKPYYNSEKFKSDPCFWNMGGSIILHDQEPLNLDLLSTYRQFRYDLKKEPIWLEQDPRDLFLMHMFSTQWPVLCHSEKNSIEVEYLRKLGLIDCYYFYHGLIARDWFRHWRHHHWQTNNQYRFLLYAREHTGSREYRKDMLESLRPMQDAILHDWKEENPVSSDYSAKIVVEDAVNSAVHIVAETLFKTQKLHVTEKVFKPMVMKQPFIVFAPARTLELLKGYGFKTFSTIWNEEYDQISDHDLRMAAVLDVIKKLYSMPQRDFQDIIYRCQEVVDYNHRYFFSDEFEKVILDELHANMGAAVAQQKHRVKTDPGGSFYRMIDSIRKRNAPTPQLMINWLEKNTRYMSVNLPDRFTQLCKQYPWVKEYL